MGFTGEPGKALGPQMGGLGTLPPWVQDPLPARFERMGFSGWEREGAGAGRGCGGFDRKMGPNWWVRYRVKGAGGGRRASKPAIIPGCAVARGSPSPPLPGADTGRAGWTPTSRPSCLGAFSERVQGLRLSWGCSVPVGEGGLAALEHSAPSLLPPAVRVGLGRALDLFLLAATWGGRSTPTLGGGYPIRGNGVPRGARRGVMGRSAG